jgi:hypothetical protein
MTLLSTEKHMLLQMQMRIDLRCTQLLNLQCQPQCTVWTCNSSHDASLSVSYIRECIWRYCKLKDLCVGQELEFNRQHVGRLEHTNSCESWTLTTGHDQNHVMWWNGMLNMWFLLIPLKQSIFQHPVCFYIHFLVLLTCLHSMWVVWESTFSSVMIFQNTSSISLLVFPTWFHLDLCHPHGCYASSFMFRICFSILLFTLKTCPYHLILLFTHLSSMIFIFKLFFIFYSLFVLF